MPTKASSFVTFGVKPPTSVRILNWSKSKIESVEQLSNLTTNGHIELEAPVVNRWFASGPNHPLMKFLLLESSDEMEMVINFQSYIVTSNELSFPLVGQVLDIRRHLQIHRHNKGAYTVGFGPSGIKEVLLTGINYEYVRENFFETEYMTRYLDSCQRTIQYWDQHSCHPSSILLDIMPVCTSHNSNELVCLTEMIKCNDAIRNYREQQAPLNLILQEQWKLQKTADRLFASYHTKLNAPTMQYRPKQSGLAQLKLPQHFDVNDADVLLQFGLDTDQS